MATKKKWVALLRAVLPATHKKMSMQQLRESCEQAGLEEVRTHAASGNLLFTSALPKTKLIKVLNDIVESYDLSNHVVLRTPAQLKAVIKAAPLVNAATERPNLLLTYFYDKEISSSAVGELVSRGGPERIQAIGRELCVDYVEGIARSKLTPVVIEKTLKQAGTARNWNVISKLIALSDDA